MFSFGNLTVIEARLSSFELIFRLQNACQLVWVTLLLITILISFTPLDDV
jgi:hypothetical protein